MNLFALLVLLLVIAAWLYIIVVVARPDAGDCRPVKRTSVAQYQFRRTKTNKGTNEDKPQNCSRKFTRSC